MSNSLARLRRIFNDGLLVRTHNQNHLTPLAEKLAPDVAKLILDIESIVDHMEFDPCSDSRAFNIGADDYTAAVLAPVLQTIHRQSPNISINVCRPPSDPEEAFQTEAIDLLISPEEIEGLEAEVLFTDRNVVALPAGLPDIGDELTEEIYGAMPQVGPSPIRVDCQATRASQLTTSCYLLVPFLMSDGTRLALFPERLSQLMKWPSIRFVEPPVELPEITVNMYWHQRVARYTHNVWLRQQLQKHTAGI